MSPSGAPQQQEEVRGFWDRPPGPYRVFGYLGRTYRVGPAAEQLTGRSRAWVLGPALAAMAAIGVPQYAFGLLVPGLLDRGWTMGQAFGLLALWTVFQAGAGFPAAYLRERGRIGPRAAMLTGAVLVPLGPLALAFDSGLVGVLGYSVLSGTGAGLVYATCSSTVAKWFPERSAAATSLATGAFACGCVPFVIAFAVGSGTGTLSPVLIATAVVLAAVIATSALLFRDPPPNWWPPHLDPREWALDRRLNPRRAARQYSSRQALRTGALPLMYVIVFLASAVSLLDVAFLAVMAAGRGLGLPAAAIGTCLLVGVNGVGRSLAIRISAEAGRVRTIRAVVAILGAGQLVLAGAVASGSVALLLLAAVVAGAGGGAFYPLFASLAREYFGERSHLETNAVIYSAKALGGVAGVGAVALVATSWGYTTIFLIAGALALGAASLCRRLRQPGLLSTIPVTRSPLPGV
ncbi:MFS transporter [Amycolatopsis sp. YIM 10]|uniref:MFS transporter n=1 Tax=Amycolatopsis sp. YIM 10 TaxID=2653857 RepID=UPI0012A88F56|nr:MFS transporter [Amycolatopsis sp. YIM 10]QFU88992.1 Oxalate:formate antiporter [Amycolatopsis sp. YIM 10]